MSAMSLGLPESSRTLIPHDVPHQSSPPLALRRDAIERGNGLPYTTSHNAFPPHDSPRLPTPAARARAVRLGAEGTQVRSGNLHHRSGSPTSEDSPVSRASPSDLSDGDCDSPGNDIGPVRSIKSHSRRQPPGHIPRPRNAFILYRSWYVKQGFLADVETDHREISRIVGKIWKGLPEDERDVWRGRAEAEKRTHALKHPNYKYSPNSRRDGAPPPARNTPVRTSAARARKTKSGTPSENRLDNIAEAFLSVSRQHGLTNRIRELDEKRKGKEIELVVKRAALASRVRVPRSSQLAANARPSPPQLGTNSGDSSTSSSDSASPAVPSSQGHANHVEGDSPWSLAACSAPLPDPEFTLDFNASNPDSMDHSYDSEVAHSWPFRQGFSGSETLNTIMASSCDDLTVGYGLSTDSADDSTFYHQYSVTASTENEPSAFVESALSPFSRIALEGSFSGYPAAAPFDMSYGMLPTDYDLTGSYFDQLQQSALAEGMPSTSTTASDNSTQGQSDIDLLEEWCAPDSPVFTDDTHTPTTSTSSGAPSPPLLLESPAPKYPQRPGLLCSSWATDSDDLDAYKYAIGGVRAELDGRGMVFGVDGFGEE
ncbi:hypothetical protein FRC06_002171 [Ceratobasidium sp. 370]|nr:hypothetical protein FRC06_002171 [Ceratobasidium sp. 370]